MLRYLSRLIVASVTFGLVIAICYATGILPSTTAKTILAWMTAGILTGLVDKLLFWVESGK